MTRIAMALLLMLAPLAAQNELEEENKQLRKDNEALRKALADMDARNRSVQNDLENRLSEMHKNMRKELDQRSEHYEHLLNKAKAAIEEEVEKAQGAVHAMEARLADTQNKKAELEMRLEDAGSELSHAQRANRRLTDKLEMLLAANRRKIARLVTMLPPEAKKRWEARVKCKRILDMLNGMIENTEELPAAAGAEALYAALKGEDMASLVELGLVTLIDVNKNGAKEIADVWGNPFIVFPQAAYGKPAVVTNARGEQITMGARKRKGGKFYNPDGFQLISLGPDGILSDDDVLNFVPDKK